MPLKPTKNIWFNNELVPWESAQVHVLSYALHYGSAVFEGITS
jgi:branched-chain amino acid aminotransferase